MQMTPLEIGGMMLLTMVVLGALYDWIEQNNDRRR